MRRRSGDVAEILGEPSLAWRLIRGGPEAGFVRLGTLESRGIVGHRIGGAIGGKAIHGGLACAQIGLVGGKARRSRIETAVGGQVGGIVVEPGPRGLLGGRRCGRRIDEAEGLWRAGLVAERGARLGGRHGGVDQLRLDGRGGLAEATAVGIAPGCGRGIVFRAAVGSLFDRTRGESTGRGSVRRRRERIA